MMFMVDRGGHYHFAGCGTSFRLTKMLVSALAETIANVEAKD
jgi:hypothetical protein